MDFPTQPLLKRIYNGLRLFLYAFEEGGRELEEVSTFKVSE